MNAKLLAAGLLLLAACSDPDAPQRVSTSETQRPTLPPNHPPLDAPAPGTSDPHAGMDMKGAQVPAAQPASATPLAAPTPVVAGDLGFVAPAGWIQEKPTGMFRVLQFRLPRADGDAADAELWVTGPIMGTKQANIDRWLAEMTQPDGKPSKDVAKISERKVGVVDVYEVDLTGTAGGGAPMMGGAAKPRPGSRLIGVGIERVVDGTPTNVGFVKLVGPEATVAKWESSFRAFVDSVGVK